MTLNSSLRNAAESMLNNLGMDAELIVEQITMDRAANRSYVSGETRYAVKVSPPAPFTQLVNGTYVVTEDLVVLLAAQNLVHVPAVGEKLELAGKVYSIIGAPPLYGGNDPVAYEVRLAK